MPVDLSDGRTVRTLDEREAFIDAVLARADRIALMRWDDPSIRLALRSGALLALDEIEGRP